MLDQSQVSDQTWGYGPIYAAYRQAGSSQKEARQLAKQAVPYLLDSVADMVQAGEKQENAEELVLLDFLQSIRPEDPMERLQAQSDEAAEMLPALLAMPKQSKGPLRAGLRESFERSAALLDQERKQERQRAEKAPEPEEQEAEQQP